MVSYAVVRGRCSARPTSSGWSKPRVLAVVGDTEVKRRCFDRWLALRPDACGRRKKGPRKGALSRFPRVIGGKPFPAGYVSAQVVPRSGRPASAACIPRDGMQWAPRRRTGAQRQRFSYDARYYLRLTVFTGSIVRIPGPGPIHESPRTGQICW